MRARRRFNHLYEELSIAVGRVAPRYALWMALQDRGMDPEALHRAEVLSFVDEHLGSLLAEHGLALSPRGSAQLRRRLARFDARYPTPYETMERLGQAARS